MATDVFTQIIMYSLRLIQCRRRNAVFAVTSAGLSYPCLEMEDGDSVALTIQDGTSTTIVVLVLKSLRVCVVKFNITVEENRPVL